MAPVGIIILLRNIYAAEGQTTFDAVLTPGEIFQYSFAMSEKDSVSFLLFVRYRQVRKLNRKNMR